MLLSPIQKYLNFSNASDHKEVSSQHRPNIFQKDTSDNDANADTRYLMIFSISHDCMYHWW